jgi:uncharacterized repeat protein (TIGR01451 family)
MSARIRVTAVLAVGFAGLLAFFATTPAIAATGSPQWTVTSVSLPTNFSPVARPGEDTYKVTVANSGGVSSEGSVEVTDELPHGLALDATGAYGENPLDGVSPGAGFSCLLRTCTYSGVVSPGQTLSFTFPVDVSPEAAGLSPVMNVVRVSGGGAPDASMSTPTAISEAPAGVGFSPGGSTTSLSSYQAGAHPDITTTVAFNTTDSQGSLAGYTKDVTDLLPTGFAGDLVDTPSCSGARFAQEECSVGAQVGVVTVTFKGSEGRLFKPLYNLAPNSGEVAKIGFLIGSGVSFEAGVSLRGDYGLTATFANIDESFAPITSVSLTLWGVPASAIHDPLRWKREGDVAGIGSFGHPSEVAPAPFFTNPTSCTILPLEAEFKMDTWEEPGRVLGERMPFGPMVGCDRLTMEPSLTLEATSSSASSPTGLDLGETIPQTYDNAEGLATSNLKKLVVTLPEGVTVNPSAGAGLGDCTPEQYAEEATQYVAGVGCPSDSKLGTIRVHSPAIGEEVYGSVYLARPYENPFKSLLALYIVARVPARGILLKAAGEVSANPVTGQLVTTFDDLPPLPFGHLTFSFRQGATSPLVTPPVCGGYTALDEGTPWANPLGAPLMPAIPPFEITSGVGGGPCPSGGTPPFAPKLVSGSQDNDAGAYSPFYLRIVREDGEQELTRFSTVFPPGITGKLAGIPLCPQADIEAARSATGTEELEHPSCPAASEIGHTTVSAGVGSVLVQTPGRVYLAGAYHGSGLSVVSITAAKVGPFDLGTVVIQFTLRINPTTAQVEVDGATSDPIPHIIDGIVVHVREIRAYIDREKFIINPTNCDPLSISSTITGAGADYANPADQVPVMVSSPFQAADCSSLAFKPVFKASTSAHTSRIDGASLHVTLALPEEQGPGKEANVARVKVSLPKQLPSPLKTLQKACTENVFAENPGNCPASSQVGSVRVNTPILANPLTGPAYFVSHGGAKYPELIMVLSGEDGIQVQVHGETFISKQGITSATFSTVPDVPFSQFELTFPEREDPALTANGNLCKGTLLMPTEMVGQNGMVLTQSTKISVTGCPKVKKASHKKKKARHHKSAEGKGKKKR